MLKNCKFWLCLQKKELPPIWQITFLHQIQSLFFSTTHRCARTVDGFSPPGFNAEKVLAKSRGGGGARFLNLFFKERMQESGG
jgi:hypothetical protein